MSDSLKRTLRTMYVGAVTLGVTALLALAATCSSAAPEQTVTPSPSATTVTAPVPSPQPSGLEGVVTATPSPTPQATQQPPPPATATTKPLEPTAAATATPTLEERAQAVVDKYRNDTTTVITDYATIKPVVDAVLQGTGLKYDNLIPQIWPDSRFGPWYCHGGSFGQFKDEQTCLAFLKANPDLGLASPSGKFVIIREGQFYQVVTTALREILLGMSHENYNLKSGLSREIAGNLGFSFAKPKLAEMFGYDPNNNVADTPENRAKTVGNFTGGETDLWDRAAWLINESRGHLDRSHPEKALTPVQALDSYNFFVNLPNPDEYVAELVAKNDIQKDSEWVNKALLSRLKPGKQQSDFDRVVLKDRFFYLP